MRTREQVPGINTLKGTEEDRTEKRQSNNGAVIEQNPSSSSRDVHNLIWPLSSAGTKAPTQVEDGIMRLIIISDFSQLRLGPWPQLYGEVFQNPFINMHVPLALNLPSFAAGKALLWDISPVFCVAVHSISCV